MSTNRYQKKKEAIHEEIARVLARKGYHATSIREIASELNINKSSLYHYIGSKEEALFFIISSGMDEALETLGKIVAKDISAEQRLEELLVFYASRYCQDPERLLLLMNDFKFLSEKHKFVLVEKQKMVLNYFIKALNELAVEGKIKNINTKVAIFAFVGMAHYTVNWYRSGGKVGFEELARNFVEIFTKGIFK